MPTAGYPENFNFQKNIRKFHFSENINFYRQKDKVVHIKISNTGDCYHLYDFESFATLSELIQVYTQEKGQLTTADGEITELLQPLYTFDPTNERCCLHGEKFFYYMGSHSSATWGDILLSHGETIFYHWGDILLSQLKLHILFKEFYQTYSFRKFLYLRKYYFISENII